MSISSPGRSLQWEPGDTHVYNPFDPLRIDDEFPKSFNKKNLKRKTTKNQATPISNLLETMPNTIKYLVVSRVDDNPDLNMNKVSPFLIKKSISDCAGQNITIKKLKNGTLLLMCTSRQAIQLLKLTNFYNQFKVKVEEHKTLNLSKGVIMCRDLKYCSDEEIKENLASQNVSDVYRIQRKVNGELKSTISFILTFKSPELPETVTAGYIVLRVRPYVPQPMRCFNCQAFGHTTKSCEKEPICAICAKVTSDSHNSKECKQPAKCSNCPANHPSFSRECEIYKEELEIQKIKTCKKLTYYAARKEYKEKKAIPPPIIQYSSIVKNNELPLQQKHTTTEHIISNKIPKETENTDKLETVTDTDTDKDITTQHSLHTHANSSPLQTSSQNLPLLKTNTNANPLTCAPAALNDNHNNSHQFSLHYHRSTDDFCSLEDDDMQL